MNALQRVEEKIGRVNNTTTETRAAFERIDTSEGGVVLPLSP